VKYTRHIAGEMDGLVQRCVLCGQIICDYRGAMVYPPSAEPPKGWEPGEIFISVKTNPTHIVSQVFDEDEVESCQ